MKIGEHKQIILYLHISEVGNKKYLQSDSVKSSDCIGELLTELGHKEIPLKPIKLSLYPKYNHLDLSAAMLEKVGLGLAPEIK